MEEKKFDIENQYELSYELLYFLKWLVEFEASSLQKLVKRAVSSEFKQRLKQQERTEKVSENIQYTILDFLDLLESLIEEELYNESVKQAQKQNLLPAVNKIDSYECDVETVRSSINTATAQIKINPDLNAKDILCKEILKHWKPSKNQGIH